jgi:hypothetical protein
MRNIKIRKHRKWFIFTLFVNDEKFTEFFIICFSFAWNTIKYFNEKKEWKKINITPIDTFYFNNILKKWVYKWKKKLLNMKNW